MSPGESAPAVAPEAVVQAPCGTDSLAPAEAPRTTRRGLFAAGAALAASVLSSREAAAQRIVRPRTPRPQAQPVPGDALNRLVRRITNGVTEEELDLAKSLGFRKYLEYHLNPAAIDDSAVESFVATNYPDLGNDVTGLFRLDRSTLAAQLYHSTVYRAAFSKRQLYERMVHFWTDHFTIYYPKVYYLKVVDDREVVRRHALGTFPDILRASAHSPAMLAYLDNTQSRVNRVNQNYARELMELHTLGVDGGYTQTDVEEVTRALTGWTIAGRGNFNFDPAGHDFTAKTILGQTLPAMPATAGAAGIQDGETVLNILLAHPSTARFISTKMVRWLLQYDPPEALVNKVAATFTRTGGDIPTMIRDILTPANLLAAPAKYRQPYQLVLAALRATQPRVTSVTNMTRQLDILGQPLFQWEDPDGYPDRVDWWAGLVLQRWNFCSFLAAQSAGNMIVDVTPLMQINTPAAIAAAIGRRLFGDDTPVELTGQVQSYLAAAPVTVARVREAFALALSSTHFQWY
ncbi:MAG: DUF1800 domain-containing protein [Gemmatimonadetes bacterium]|nr:DUF1800 domain-containing protein [Gemmatimonadota bacterium]